MPLSSNDANRHNKNITSETSKRRWADIVNSVLAGGGTERVAMRKADSVIRGSSPFNRDTVSRRLNRKGYPGG